MINTTVSCLYIRWSPCGVLRIQSHHAPLCGLDAPEKTSPGESHIFDQTWSSLLYRIDATISCLYIKQSPNGVLQIQWHHTPLRRTWLPREDLSRRNTHFRQNLMFTSVWDKRDNFLHIYQMVPLRGSVNPTTLPSPYADLVAQRRPLQRKHTFSTKHEVHFYIG